MSFCEITDRSQPVTTMPILCQPFSNLHVSFQNAYVSNVHDRFVRRLTLELSFVDRLRARLVHAKPSYKYLMALSTSSRFWQFSWLGFRRSTTSMMQAVCLIFVFTKNFFYCFSFPLRAQSLKTDPSEHIFL